MSIAQYGGKAFHLDKHLTRFPIQVSLEYDIPEMNAFSLLQEPRNMATKLDDWTDPRVLVCRSGRVEHAIAKS